MYQSLLLLEEQIIQHQLEQLNLATTSSFSTLVKAELAAEMNGDKDYCNNTVHRPKRKSCRNGTARTSVGLSGHTCRKDDSMVLPDPPSRSISPSLVNQNVNRVRVLRPIIRNAAASSSSSLASDPTRRAERGVRFALD